MELSEPFTVSIFGSPAVGRDVVAVGDFLNSMSMDRVSHDI